MVRVVAVASASGVPQADRAVRELRIAVHVRRVRHSVRKVVRGRNRAVSVRRQVQRRHPAVSSRRAASSVAGRAAVASVLGVPRADRAGKVLTIAVRGLRAQHSARKAVQRRNLAASVRRAAISVAGRVAAVASALGVLRAGRAGKAIAEDSAANLGRQSLAAEAGPGATRGGGRSIAANL